MGGRAYPGFASLARDDGGVVLLVEGKVVDALAAAADIALDAGVVLERDRLLDVNVQLAGELMGALRQRRRGHERSRHFVLGILDAGGDDGPEKLEDMLLVNRLVPRPALALDDLDGLVTRGQEVAP